MNRWLIAAGTAALVLTLLFIVPVPRGHSQVTSITLTWTAPGDDGSIGTASSYEIRYSSTRPDTTGMAAWLQAGGTDSTVPSGLATWWNSATRVTAPIPAPKPAGSIETYAVPGPFATGPTYFFMLRTCDEALNCARSNIASRALPDTLPPRPVLDLRAL